MSRRSHIVDMSLLQAARGLYFFGVLVKNPDRLDSVFEMRDAMTSEDKARPVMEALKQTGPSAIAAFRDKPRLGKLDVAKLAAMPAETLGGAHGRFLQKNGLDPNAIPTLSGDEDWEYMSAHLYETHDLWHTLTGFHVDVAGEGGLQAFYAAQIPGPLASALIAAIMLNHAVSSQHGGDAAHLETTRRLDAIAEGWLMGKHAAPLFGFRFRERFGDSLADIRRELGIVPFGGNARLDVPTNHANDQELDVAAAE
jgi:ubiquinone biosynthesis protein COQ4